MVGRSMRNALMVMACLSGTLAPAGSVSANEAMNDDGQRADATHVQPPTSRQDARDQAVMGIHGFSESHPDMHYRALGLEARRNGRFEQARAYFRIAARHSDKQSQAALAEMLWNGEGGVADKPLAYAWMDLAAERGTAWIVLFRESYWARLDAGERRRAIGEGRAVYAEFADDVAKPRLAHRLRVARNNATGSRTGWIGNGLRIHDTNSVSDAGAGRAPPKVTADDYYSDRYWDPETWFAWQDRLLRSAPQEGRVDMGPLQPLRDQDQGQ